MTVLHLLASGGTGGIEVLCKDYGMFSRNNNIVLTLWNGGCIAEEMQNQGIKVINLNAARYDFRKLRKNVLRIITQELAQVVVAHHAAPMAHILLMIIKNKYPEIRTVAYGHGNAIDICRHKQKKGLWLRRHIFTKSMSCADHIIAASESIKKSLIQYLKAPEDRITVIYNGVVMERFGVKKHVLSAPLEIIYVGRLIEEKGVQATIEGLALLPEDLAYRFRIVGDGPFRKTLETLVKTKNLTDRIEFLGNRRDVSELLASADVFIHLPFWEEGFGITIVEAMASGLICICSDRGGIGEIIENQKNGFLIPETKPELLADFLRTALPKLTDQEMDMIRNNSVNSAHGFSIKAYTDKMDKLLSGGMNFEKGR